MRLAKSDMVWLAGALETKAVIASWGNGRGRNVLHVYFSISNEALLEEVAFLLGANTKPVVGSGAWSRKACSKHCPSDHVHVIPSSSTRQVIVRGVRAHVVLYNLLPFFRTKGEEIRKEISKADPPNFQNSRNKGIVSDMIICGWQLPD